MIRDSLVNLILQQRNLDWTQHVFQDKDVVVMVFMDPVEDEKKFQAWKEDAWPSWLDSYVVRKLDRKEMRTRILSHEVGPVVKGLCEEAYKDMKKQASSTPLPIYTFSMFRNVGNKEFAPDPDPIVFLKPNWLSTSMIADFFPLPSLRPYASREWSLAPDLKETSWKDWYPFTEEVIENKMKLLRPHILRALKGMCWVCRIRCQAKKCGFCGEVWYCGLQCQREDWSRHQNPCTGRTSDHASQPHSVT